MSASREKKQRQGAGPDHKASQARQTQAERKRKTVIYSIIGAVAVVLVAALLIWNSGFFQRRATAATIGGQNLSAAELSYYYYNVRYSYVQYGEQYAALMGYDVNKADNDQFFNEEEKVTWRTHFLENALVNAQQTLALYDQAIAAGHTQSEVKASVDRSIESMKSSATASGYNYATYLRLVFGKYMTPGIFEKLTTRDYMANLASNDKFDELYDGYTQEDLDKYYSENADTLDTFEYSYLTFAAETVETKDADGNDLPEDEVKAKQDEALAAAKAKAEEALAAYEDGDSVESLISKYELTASQAADHATTVGSSGISSAYREDLLKLDKDKAALVEGSSSCYVVVFHSRTRLEDPTRDVRHILIRAENTVDSDGKLVAPTDEAWAAAKEKMDAVQAEWNSSAKTEDAFAELANKHSDDGDGTTGGLIERIAVSDSYVPEFLDWIYADGRQPGDVGMVQHSAETGSTNGYYGYHLIYLVGDNEPVWARTARNSLANTATTDWLTDLAETDYAASLTGGADSIGT